MVFENRKLLWKKEPATAGPQARGASGAVAEEQFWIVLGRGRGLL